MVTFYKCVLPYSLEPLGNVPFTAHVYPLSFWNFYRKFILNNLHLIQ